MEYGTGYEFTSFNPRLAMAGTPTAVKIGNVYKVVEKLEKLSSDSYMHYPYRAWAEDAYYDFDNNGISMSTETLWLVAGQISAAGGIRGDVQHREDGFYKLISINYRESVAIQVLNALIYHFPDPLTYNTATIKLLITKAFEFSKEFLNQALDLRLSNASLDPDTGEVVEDADTTVTALNNVAQQLVNLVTQNTAIKNALDGTTANGISARMDTANSKLESIKTNIGTVGTNIQTGDANIVTALSGVSSNVANIKTNVSASTATLSTINDTVLSIDSKVQ